MPKLVRVGISKMLDAMQEGKQQALAELLVKLVKNGSIPQADFLEGLQKDLDMLGDLMYPPPLWNPMSLSQAVVIEQWVTCRFKTSLCHVQM